jgi:hypothetical protein
VENRGERWARGSLREMGGERGSARTCPTEEADPLMIIP